VPTLPVVEAVHADDGVDDEVEEGVDHVHALPFHSPARQHQHGEDVEREGGDACDVVPVRQLHRRARALVVAVQGAFESKGLKPVSHLIGSRVLSSYGSTGFNVYSPTSSSTSPRW
jgi:hypothetical protein